MTEQQLQHNLVMWFSQEYPQFRGLLFEINNDTRAMKQAMRRRAMGMITGASDLGFIDPLTGMFIGIELKAPGSRHDLKHIKSQIEWGHKVMEAGGMYLMCSELDTIKMFISNVVSGMNGREHEIRKNVWIEVLNKIEQAEWKGKKSVTF